MSSAAFLFVYGTLKSGCRSNRYARYLASHANLLGRALIPGRLYALRRYPCLRRPLDEDGWVEGEVYRLRTPDRTLQVLDTYESSEYRRVQRLATLEDGHEVRCWVYERTSPLARWRRVEDGSWP